MAMKGLMLTEFGRTLDQRCYSESLHYVIEVHDAGQGVPDMKVVIAGQWDPDKDKFNKKLGRVKRWQKFSPVFRQERCGWKENWCQ